MPLLSEKNKIRVTPKLQPVNNLCGIKYCLLFLLASNNSIVWKEKKKKALHQAVNLRLGGSSDSKSYETPQEQQPAIDWSEGAQQTEVKSHAHTDDQTLCVWRIWDVKKKNKQAQTHGFGHKPRLLTRFLPCLSAKCPHIGEPKPIPMNTIWRKKKKKTIMECEQHKCLHDTNSEVCVRKIKSF